MFFLSFIGITISYHSIIQGNKKMHGSRPRDISLQKMISALTALSASHPSAESFSEKRFSPHISVLVSSSKKLIFPKTMFLYQLCPTSLKLWDRNNLIYKLMQLLLENRVLTVYAS